MEALTTYKHHHNCRKQYIWVVSPHDVEVADLGDVLQKIPTLTKER